MSNWKELVEEDCKRYGDKPKGWLYRFLYYYRAASNYKKSPLKYYYRFMYRRIKEKHGIEISWSTSIGRGFSLGHPYNITINPLAVIGDNFTIQKGITIGQENRGKRKGVPTIGNSVFIGANSTVVGNITIGDDVLIAPNSYVNCDVPSHSIVIGSPCQIKSVENATEDYVVNKV